MHHAVLGHEHVGGAGLGHVAEGVADERVVEAARLRLAQARGHCWDRGSRPSNRSAWIRGSGGGSSTSSPRAARHRHRRLEQGQAEPGRFRIRHDRRQALGLAPVHRLHVERRARRELLHALADEVDDRLRPPWWPSGRWTRAERLTRSQCRSRSGIDALEHAGAVEHRRAEPGGVGARADDGRIALVPRAVEPVPGLRIPSHLSQSSIGQNDCRIESLAGPIVNRSFGHRHMKSCDGFHEDV